MARFGKIESNIIIDIILANQEFINILPDSKDWVELTNSLIGIGWNYDINSLSFYPPQPYPSWTLNTNTYNWEPPIAYPTDDKNYVWDEENQIWNETSLPI